MSSGATDPPGPRVPAGRLRDLGQPRLGAPGLLLRPWARADAETLVRAYADPDVRYWNLSALAGPQEAVAAIDRWADDWRAERRGVWAVTDSASGEVLGRVALRDISLAYGLAECTYWTLPQARGRGVAATAARTTARWALEVAGLHRVEVQHSVRNAASCRVALRAGFRAEGVRRSALYHADGWHDMHCHALVAGDPELRTPPPGKSATPLNNVGPGG